MRRFLPLILTACASPAPEPVGPPPPGGPPPGAHDPPPRAVRRDEPPSPKRDKQPDNLILALHNQYRADHCAPPLDWSDKLAKVAQKWADKLAGKGCSFGHSTTNYGENLAAGTAGALDEQTVVDMWYREVDIYNFGKPGFDMETGHFTQLVWVGTQHVGCGRSSCKGNDIVVCNYDPPGNVMTLFDRNVLAKGCKKARR